MTSTTTDMPSPEWTAWSNHRPEITKPALRALRTELGPLAPVPEAPIAAARLPVSRLSPQALAALESAAGAGAVRVDDEARARHAGGQSLFDLLRRRAGDASAAPDAVVTPDDRDAVTRLLAVAADHRLAVVPWGGGTSVVGGLDPVLGNLDAIVALDLSRLDRLLSVDRESLMATFEPGIRTPAAEAALSEHGLTLGHFPQSYARASLGGYVVTRSAGQASSGTGRIDDLVVALRMATPSGELVLPELPSSAAGPDLRRLVLGSEGSLGVLTEVTLRVRSQAAKSRYEAWVAPDWHAGREALRAIAQRGVLPDVLRLSDPEETRISLLLGSTPGWQRRALAGWLRLHGIRRGCLVIAGFEGDRDDIDWRRRAARRPLHDVRAVPIGTGAGQAWRRHRFDGPALRDSLFDAGAIVETLETAATWSRLDAVRAAVVDALHAALPRALVGCHISHLYPTGASLYFTVLFAGDSEIDDVLERWSTAKEAATTAMLAAGGTVTHHHGVGTMHRDYAAGDQGGDVGRMILAAIKQAVDPNGICNPGKLLG